MEASIPGFSIHVVDVSRGIVAAGMPVAVFKVDDDGTRYQIAGGVVGPEGTLDDPAIRGTLDPGFYEAVFDLGAYFRGQAVVLPEIPFLDVVTFRFGIADPAAHYHLPFKCTPWGYSCFRGGA